MSNTKSTKVQQMEKLRDLFLNKFPQVLNSSRFEKSLLANKIGSATILLDKTQEQLMESKQDPEIHRQDVKQIKKHNLIIPQNNVTSGLQLISKCKEITFDSGREKIKINMNKKDKGIIVIEEVSQPQKNKPKLALISSFAQPGQQQNDGQNFQISNKKRSNHSKLKQSQIAKSSMNNLRCKSVKSENNNKYRKKLSQEKFPIYLNKASKKIFTDSFITYADLTKNKSHLKNSFHTILQREVEINTSHSQLFINKRNFSSINQFNKPGKSKEINQFYLGSKIYEEQKKKSVQDNLKSVCSVNLIDPDLIESRNEFFSKKRSKQELSGIGRNLFNKSKTSFPQKTDPVLPAKNHLDQVRVKLSQRKLLYNSYNESLKLLEENKSGKKEVSNDSQLISFSSDLLREPGGTSNGYLRLSSKQKDNDLKKDSSISETPISEWKFERSSKSFENKQGVKNYNFKGINTTQLGLNFEKLDQHKSQHSNEGVRDMSLEGFVLINNNEDLIRSKNIEFSEISQQPNRIKNNFAILLKKEEENKSKNNQIIHEEKFLNNEKLGSSKSYKSKISIPSIREIGVAFGISEDQKSKRSKIGLEQSKINKWSIKNNETPKNKKQIVQEIPLRTINQSEDWINNNTTQMRNSLIEQKGGFLDQQLKSNKIQSLNHSILEEIVDEILKEDLWGKFVTGKHNFPVSLNQAFTIYNL